MQTILVRFCRKEFVTEIIPMLPTFSQNLILQEAFETAAQINEERKITAEFDGAFCKTFKLLINRFSSFSRYTWKIGGGNDPPKAK